MRATLLTLGTFVLVAYCQAADFEKIDSPVAPSENIHYVLLPALPSQSDADEVAARLKAAGYNPVSVAATDNLFQVKVAQLDNAPDAEEIKDDLIANDFPDSVTSSSRRTSKDESAISSKVSAKSNRLGLKELPPYGTLQAPDADEVVTAAGLPPPAEMDRRADFSAVKNEMRRTFDGRPDSDPVKGYAQYYFALALERTGAASDGQAALAIYRNIAMGKVAAPQGYRRRALLQYVDFIHYTEEKHIDAYRLYKLLLASDWLEADGQPEILAELSGCIHEMMDHHKLGSPSEVRHELKEIYAQIPENSPKARATVELIYSMTWFWEGSTGGLDRALAHSRLLQEKYPNVPAVTCQAVWNEAVSLERMGKISEARNAAEKAIKVYIDPDDAFRNRMKTWNMEKRIAGLIARLEKQLGNTEAVTRWTTYGDGLQDSSPTLQMRVPGVKS